MSTTIFLLAACAGICYAVQGTLLSKYAREFDGFTSSLFRNASFIITMLPILYFAGWDGIISMKNSWGYILLSGVFGMMSLSFTFSAHKYLPVAIANAIGQLSPLLIFVWTFFLLGLIPSWQELLFVGVILLGLVILNTTKYEFTHLDGDHKKGFIFAFSGIVLGSISVSMMVAATKISDPYAVGYFWESTIGVFFIMAYFAKKKILGKKDAKLPSRKKILYIALAASPTIIGSFLLPLAMSMGTPGAISTVVSGVAAITGMTLAWIIYKEKLSPQHLLGVACILAGVGLMRMF